MILPGDPIMVGILKEGEADERLYHVVGVTECGSRGREFKLSGVAHGPPVRVCHAPPRGLVVGTAYTSFAKLRYIYR